MLSRLGWAVSLSCSRLSSPVFSSQTCSVYMEKSPLTVRLKLRTGSVGCAYAREWIGLKWTHQMHIYKLVCVGTSASCLNALALFVRMRQRDHIGGGRWIQPSSVCGHPEAQNCYLPAMVTLNEGPPRCQITINRPAMPPTTWLHSGSPSSRAHGAQGLRRYKP